MVKASFCAQVTHFCVYFDVCFDCVLLEDPNHGHYKISNRGSQVLIFYLLVLIESMMPCI